MAASDRTGMSELYLLRHATAVPQQEGGLDRERPLEPRGRRAAQAIAGWIAEHQLAPALVLCSPALRTRETLDLVAGALAHPPRILFEEELYLATAARQLNRLRQVPADTPSVMVIGHNPGLYELALHISEVSGGPLMARLGSFPAGALAIFSLAVDWSGLERRRARLAQVVTPDELMRGVK
jgi:phosphohistidine phosphatase